MNKKIYNLFIESGLHQTSNNTFEGSLGGYHVHLGYFPMQPMSTRILFPVYIKEESRQTIVNELNPYKNQFFNFGFDQFGLFVLLDSFAPSTFPKQWNKMIPIIINSLETHNVSKEHICPSCGCELTPDNSREVTVQFAKPTMCLDCISKINSSIEERNQEIDKAPGSYLKGFLGGLLGALCGAGVYFLISLLGFISSLGALVGAVLGFVFANKFGGKKNVPMFIIVVLTNIAVIALTMLWMYTRIALGLALEAGVTNITSWQAFATCMQDGEFSRMVYLDIGASVFFSIIGTISPLLRQLSTIRKGKSI